MRALEETGRLLGDRCSLCGGKCEVEVTDLFDTRFGIPSLYSVLQCRSCGLEQTVPRPSADEIKTLYEKHYNFGGESRTAYTRARQGFLLSPAYRLWLKVDGDISFHLARGAGRLLDVGCNEGRGLTIYQRNGFEVEGLELNENAAKVAQSSGFNVQAQPVEDFRPVRPCDVVVLSNVLEHATDPAAMLREVRRLLNPGGEAWISCPNSHSWLRALFRKHWINWHVPFHYFHFSPASLSKLLTETGFTVIRMEQETPALWVAQSLLARFFGRRGKATLQLRKPVLVASLMLLIRSVLFPLLWLGNRTGHGDCLVVVAKKA